MREEHAWQRNGAGGEKAWRFGESNTKGHLSHRVRTMAGGRSERQAGIPIMNLERQWRFLNQGEIQSFSCF